MQRHIPHPHQDRRTARAIRSRAAASSCTTATAAWASCAPTEPMDYFYKNGQTDELYFIHEGTGRFETISASSPTAKATTCFLPHGTIYRIVDGRG